MTHSAVFCNGWKILQISKSQIKGTHKLWNAASTPTIKVTWLAPKSSGELSVDRYVSSCHRELGAALLLCYLVHIGPHLLLHSLVHIGATLQSTLPPWLGATLGAGTSVVKYFSGIA